MSEPALKCENNAIFKQNYTLELFISLKMAICCCFGLKGNLEFPDFLQKKFYNINYRGPNRTPDSFLPLSAWLQAHGIEPITQHTLVIVLNLKSNSILFKILFESLRATPDNPGC